MRAHAALSLSVSALVLVRAFGFLFAALERVLCVCVCFSAPFAFGRKNISCVSLIAYLLVVVVDLRGLVVAGAGFFKVLARLTFTSSFISISIRGGCRSSLTLVRQLSLSSASFLSAGQEKPAGTSISRSPSLRLSNIYLAAWCTSLSSSIRRICPTHCSRRARIHLTTSKVRVRLLASSRTVLCVSSFFLLYFVLYCILYSIVRCWVGR